MSTSKSKARQLTLRLQLQSRRFKKELKFLYPQFKVAWIRNWKKELRYQCQSLYRMILVIQIWFNLTTLLWFKLIQFKNKINQMKLLSEDANDVMKTK